MNNFPNTTSDIQNYDSVFLTGQELAKLLDVSAAALSSAIKEGHNCCGYPISEWAEFSDSGRTKGYHVPSFLIEESEESEEKQRNNPVEEEQELNLGEIKPESADIQTGSQEKPEPTQQDSPNVTHVQNSLLPKGENYCEPVASYALSSTVQSAMQYDTPQSRTVVSAGVTGLGAIVGHAVSDSPTGAAIGAGIGLGLSYFVYWQNQKNNQTNTPSSHPHTSKEDLIAEYVNKAEKSGYVN